MALALPWKLLQIMAMANLQLESMTLPDTKVSSTSTDVLYRKLTCGGLNALRSPHNSRRSPVDDERRQDSHRSTNTQDHLPDDTDSKRSPEDDYGIPFGLDSKGCIWNDSNDDNGQCFIQQYAEIPPSIPSGRLSCPVIIPQRRPEDKSRGWLRAYAPALMECGIDQAEFISFIESFNEASKVRTPYPQSIARTSLYKYDLC